MAENITFELMKLIVSFLTPLIILFIGIFISRKIEKMKSFLSKEKDWQNWWANKFLQTAHDFNNSVTNIVTGLFQYNQIEKEKLSNWQEDLKEKENAIRSSMEELQVYEWEIQNYVIFANKQGHNLLKKQNNLLGLLRDLFNEKQGDLEKIRQCQFEFNQSIRLAHAELLGLKN